MYQLLYRSEKLQENTISRKDPAESKLAHHLLPQKIKQLLAPQYNLLNPGAGVDSPNLGKNASLSSDTCRHAVILTNESQTKGELHKAYPNIAKPLTIPSEYQGNAMTKSDPNINSNGDRTGSIGKKNELIAIEESANVPSKYNDQPNNVCTVVGTRKKGTMYAARMHHIATNFSPA